MTVVKVTEDNLDDFLEVCNLIKGDKNFEEGILKMRSWALDLLSEENLIAFLAYMDNKPVAQIMGYPGRQYPLMGEEYRDFLVLQCIFNSCRECRRRGIGDKLIEKFIDEARRRGYKYIVSYAFDSGEPEAESQRNFLIKRGFKQINGGEEEDIYYSLSGAEVSDLKIPTIYRKGENYRPQREDHGTALIFYTSSCPYGYFNAIKTGRRILQIAGNLEMEIVDIWRDPTRFLDKGMNWLLVNGVPINSLPYEGDKFVEEVSSALNIG